MQIQKVKLIAGADWHFEETVDEYSSADYDIKYILKRGSDASFEIDSVDNDSGFTFDLDATETADLPAGFYSYNALAISKTDPSEIVPLEAGVVEVFANVAAASDARSFALQMVEKLRTVLLLLADQAYQSIQLEDGKAVTLKDQDSLTKQLSFWESKAGLSNTKSGLRRIKFNNIY